MLFSPVQDHSEEYLKYIVEMLESDLVGLKRKELQALAKEHGLKANKKSNELIESLLLILNSSNFNEAEENSSAEVEKVASLISTAAKDNCPDIAEEHYLKIAVGSSVSFSQGDCYHDGVIKRINKNSYRIKLDEGGEMSVPKVIVKVKEASLDKNGVSTRCSNSDVIAEFVHEPPASTPPQKIPSEKTSPQSKKSSNKKKKNNSLSQKKKSLSCGGKLSVSPIKKRTTSPSQHGSLYHAVATPKSEIKSDIFEVMGAQTESVENKEEVQCIDEMIINTKKKRNSSTNKKLNQKSKHVSIAGVTSISRESKTPSNSKGRFKKPSIVPRTTSAAKARANAISQRKSLLHSMSIPKTPNSTHTKISAQQASSRTKCTIDCSIIDKISETSRRFSSSWSTGKRQSLSKHSEKQGDAVEHPVRKRIAGVNIAGAVSKDSKSINNHSLKKNLAQPSERVARRLTSNSAHSTKDIPLASPLQRNHITKRPNSKLNVTTSRPLVGKKRSTMCVNSSSSMLTSTSAPTVLASNRDLNGKMAHKKPKLIDSSSNVKRSSSATQVQTKRKQSSTLRTTTGLSRSKSCAPNRTKEVIAAAETQTHEQVNKPFKARPAPNFSKIHKRMFNSNQSVVSSVKEVS